MLVAIGKRSLVFVKSLHDPDWHCKIDEGIAGLAFARWGPCNNYVMTVSEFKVRLTIWGLADKSVQYIKSPKHEDERGVAFSPSRKLMALAERNSEAKDSVGIYDVSGKPWAALAHFNPDTFDLEDLRFSGDGQSLIIWDSNLKCKILIYQLQLQGSHLVVAPLQKFQPYQDNSQLGIRSLEVSANNQYVAAGFFD